MATRSVNCYGTCNLRSHLIYRAVKFIRDQAQQAMDHLQFDDDNDKHRGPAQVAAQAMRKILSGGDGTAKTSIDVSSEPLDENSDYSDPMKGWTEGVSLEKGHFCLLLKPQLVLRSEASKEAVCVLAAVQGKLQTYNIMDQDNIDDPVSGKIMSRSAPTTFSFAQIYSEASACRNFASITGLQAFSPSATNSPLR